MSESESILAIDFGTTNSLVALASKEQAYEPAQVDKAASDSSILRSIIFAIDPQTVYFGQEAIDQYVERPLEGRLLKSIKRFLPDPSFRGTEIAGQPYTIQQLIGGITLLLLNLF